MRLKQRGIAGEARLTMSLLCACVGWEEREESPAIAFGIDRTASPTAILSQLVEAGGGAPC